MRKSSKFNPPKGGQSSNPIQSDSKFQPGFTLIELLVVIGVVIAAGSIIGGILFSSLRGGVKSDAMIVVRQNGSYVASQIAKMIRNAKNFGGVSTNGSLYITDCTVAMPPLPTPTPTPVRYKYVKITAFDDNETIISCENDETGSLNIASKSAVQNPTPYPYILDTSAVAITGDDCYFTCSQENIADNPRIGIYFNLEAKNTTGIAERKAEIPFETTVILRNIGK